MSHTNTLPAGNAHFISLEKAIEMTTTYRGDKETILAADYKGRNILPLSETFNAAAFKRLAATEGAAGVRLYYSMDEDLKIHAIFVAVNDKNEDILPSEDLAVEAVKDAVILEAGQRCPTICPPSSPLN